MHIIHHEKNVLKTPVKNIYWKDAIEASKKIVDMGHVWVADGAVCYWHGDEASFAQTCLTQAAVPAVAL